MPAGGPLGGPNCAFLRVWGPPEQPQDWAKRFCAHAGCSSGAAGPPAPVSAAPLDSAAAAAASAAAAAAARRPPSFLSAPRGCPRLLPSPSVSAASLLRAGPPGEGGEAKAAEAAASPRVAAVLQQLQQLTLLEVSELVRRLESVFGVSAAAALGAAAAPAAAAAAAAAPGGAPEGPPEAPPQTEFKVVLQAVPTASRIAAIKALRGLRGDLGLKEAKAFIDSLPKTVAEKINKTEAQNMLEALKAAGAEAQML
ncbi:50S ribosomal protein L12, putative [Eimeria necatrix]|uniref:50S ribosomal protein L12, putative n=1 Tax=Eimeria necatrix TaxID=51315 RepID=U6MT29_9EIME|nr:50S ribosomal protein L12, putative [Eimeria necatrix]CDJ65599.1 50S ribosomal protein L12, putative [Eimeria necatrix]